MSSWRAISHYSPGDHNIINCRIPKIMVQFCIMSLSLPPIPNILRATLLGLTRFLQYTDLSACTFRLHPPPPPPSSRESMIKCSYCIAEQIKQGRGGTYRDLDWRRRSLVQLNYFQASGMLSISMTDKDQCSIKKITTKICCYLFYQWSRDFQFCAINHLESFRAQ